MTVHSPRADSDTPTLTDRYVQAAAHGPCGDGADLERELRASIADAVDGRLAAGEAPDDAERAVLTELGDPLVLSLRYRDRPMYVVGPKTYPYWVRAMRLVFLALLPALGVLGFAVDLLEQGSVGAAITRTLSGLIDVGLWLVVVPTAVAFFTERYGDPSWTSTWTVDDLPDAGRRARLTEMLTMVTFAGLGAGALVHQQAVGVVGPDGVAAPLLDPQLWWGPIPLFLGGLALCVVLSVLRFRRGYSTAGLLVGALAVRVLLYGTAVVVAWQGLLIAPATVVRIGVGDPATDWGTVNLLAAGILVVLLVWSTVTALRRHRRDRLPAPTG